MMKIAEEIRKTKAGNHIAAQLIRSGTSQAYNYAEAEAAELPKKNRGSEK